MSTAIARNFQIGIDSTPTNNFTLYQPATPDGTLRLGNGNTGITSSLLTLTSGGNLGLGVTPSGSWGSPALMLGKPGAGNPTYPFLTSTDTQQLVIGSNSYWDGTNWKAAFAGPSVVAMQQRINYNQISWHTAAAVSQGSTQSFTQAMTLDASGRLLVGTTTQQGKLTVDAGTANGLYVTSSVGGTQSDDLKIVRTGGSGGATIAANTWIQLFNTTDNNGSGFQTYQGGTIFWGNVAGAWYERARIDSSGNLLVNNTASGYQNKNSQSLEGNNGYGVFNHASGTASGTLFVAFGYGAGGIGSITQNGTTGVLYNLTSDYRLKNNPTPITGAKEFVMALQPKTWDWWDGSGKGVGFIAHEFMEVAKYSGHGEKDAVETVEIKDEQGNVIGTEERPVYQSIQPSSSEVMANLVALLQEQQAIITSLQADVAALKAAK